MIWGTRLAYSLAAAIVEEHQIGDKVQHLFMNARCRRDRPCLQHGHGVLFHLIAVGPDIVGRPDAFMFSPTSSLI